MLKTVLSVAPNEKETTHEGSKKADAAVNPNDFSIVELLEMVGITNCVGVLEKSVIKGKNRNDL